MTPPGGSSVIRFGLVDPEGVLMDEIRNYPKLTRDDIAATYALAMTDAERVNWKEVNQAIIDRWSIAGLQYIKEKAWKARR